MKESVSHAREASSACKAAPPACPGSELSWMSSVRRRGDVPSDMARGRLGSEPGVAEAGGAAACNGRASAAPARRVAAPAAPAASTPEAEPAAAMPASAGWPGGGTMDPGRASAILDTSSGPRRHVCRLRCCSCHRRPSSGASAANPAARRGLDPRRKDWRHCHWPWYPLLLARCSTPAAPMRLRSSPRTRSRGRADRAGPREAIAASLSQLPERSRSVRRGVWAKALARASPPSAFSVPQSLSARQRADRPDASAMAPATSATPAAHRRQARRSRTRRVAEHARMARASA
mmetsp:Transcript_24104/g.90953  ORF Transcript_24104/g.90953 Transcript_24104/m.90953 type:complete len:291 (-) Transcript_24104:1614-2486(-)